MSERLFDVVKTSADVPVDRLLEEYDSHDAPSAESLANAALEAAWEPQS